MEAEKFVGPLFLVGVPRSGTKLLRGALNEHPRIRIPDVETEFLPFWVARWEEYERLDSPDGFRHFYDHCRQLPFFIQLRERGLDVDCGEWFEACKDFTPAAIFEALIRTVVSVDPGDNSTIWGDKSPSYTAHVPLLLEQFPGARVVHIIRDVRDCSLSLNKAWGKSILRAAQRWQDDVSKCRDDGRRHPGRYMEIRYEDLLADPVASLRKICCFIGVDFDQRMLAPSAATEDRGDARGARRVLSGNIGKYRSQLPSPLVSRIEMIACETLRALDYPCDYAGVAVRLPGWKMRTLQLADGWNLLRETVSGRGFMGALRFHLHYFRTSGNRLRARP